MLHKLIKERLIIASILFGSLFGVLLGVGIATIVLPQNQKSETTSANSLSSTSASEIGQMSSSALSTSSTTSSSPAGSAKILMAGDTMLAEQSADYINQGLNPFQFVQQDFLTKYDWVVLNLECNISTKGIGKPMAGKRFTFSAPPEVISRMRKSGVDMVSLANNHTMDYGGDALLYQIAKLEKAGILTFGAGGDFDSAFAPVITTVNGIKIAFVGVNDEETLYSNVGSNRPGSAYFNQSRLANTMRSARDKSDVVIVYAHWGTEHKEKADSRQVSWGKWFVDQGADLVVGAHPHVRQNVDTYKGKKIYYSLGNFIFPGMGFNPEAVIGSMLEIEFKNKKISSTKLKTVDITYHGFPKPRDK